MVVVRDKMFTSEQMRLLTINNETLSIDGKHYDAIRTEDDNFFLVCQDPQKCDDSSDALRGSVIFTDATYTIKEYGESKVYTKIDSLSGDIWEGIDWDAVPVTSGGDD